MNEYEKAKSFDDRLEIESLESIDERLFSIAKDSRYPLEVLDARFDDKTFDLNKRLIKDAVYRYSEDKLGVELYASIDNDTDIKSVVDFIDGVSSIAEEFGFNKRISKVRIEETRGSEMAHFHYVRENAELVIDKYTFSVNGDLEHYDNSDGFHPKGFSAKQIGAHEYAHAIASDMYFGSKLGDLRGMEALNASFAVEKEILERAAKDTGSSMVDAVKSVSGYAMYSSCEAFAECIADAYSNGDGAAEFSKAVYNITKTQKDDIIATVEEKWLQ